VFEKHAQIIRTHLQEEIVSHFNTADNLDYVGPYPEPKYYGADFILGDEQAPFLEWYEEKKETKFSVIKKNCWTTVWMISIYGGRHAVLFEIYF
jgi:hypothetical protein